MTTARRTSRTSPRWLLRSSPRTCLLVHRISSLPDGHAWSIFPFAVWSFFLLAFSRLNRKNPAVGAVPRASEPNILGYWSSIRRLRIRFSASPRTCVSCSNVASVSTTTPFSSCFHSLAERLWENYSLTKLITCAALLKLIQLRFHMQSKLSWVQYYFAHNVISIHKQSTCVIHVQN